MGATKQKWTSKEETALRDGIKRYKQGKWSMILKDPKFGAILHLRSNVDLKDKWRNIKVAENGTGSRHRKHTPKVKHGDMDLRTVVRGNLDVIKAEPLAVVAGTSEYSEPACTKKPMPRLDNLILDAIAKLKEPHGSSRAAISKYIEEKYVAPPKLEGLVATALQLLIQDGKLIKVKHQYMIVPLPPISENVVTTDTSKSPYMIEGKLEMPKVDTTFPILSQVEAEKMKSMTAEEAASAAARAVAEAEAAIREAEEAEKVAEQAEAEAEAARLFSDAAICALKMQNSLHLNAWKACKV